MLRDGDAYRSLNRTKNIMFLFMDDTSETKLRVKLQRRSEREGSFLKGQSKSQSKVCMTCSTHICLNHVG